MSDGFPLEGQRQCEAMTGYRDTYHSRTEQELNLFTSVGLRNDSLVPFNGSDEIKTSEKRIKDGRHRDARLSSAKGSLTYVAEIVIAA